jgi:PAS domain S-box-containing protein
MVLPQTIEEVLTLLRRPFPNAGEIADCLGRLETSESALEMPSPDTQAEGDLFDALTIIFIEPRRSQRARGAVAHAVGERHFEFLTAFLAFVRTAHDWTETHPTLAYEPDMLAVMSRQAELAQLLLDSSEAERVMAGDELRRSVADLQEVRNERAKVAEALRVSQERLKTVLAAARMAFWEWNPATDAVTASDIVDELWGLPAGERFESRRQSVELVHPEDLAAYRAKVETAVRERSRWHHQFRITRPCDGKVAWLEEHAYTTWDSNTGNVAVAGLVWAITERKLLESSLQDADRRKDEFLATLSHELRNPLAPLRNGLQIARLASKGDSPFGRTIEMMDRQLTHLVHLVDDLLDVGRISSGKIELRRDRFSLADILASSTEAARFTIDKHEHDLLINRGIEELWVEGDFDRLTQIFSNLLTNAAKYTNPGGKIALGVTREGGRVAVSIADNGIGIPSHDLPHVFELFTQGRSHQGRAQGGLGIGLSLVQQLVELHHGAVTAFSEGTDKGSTFTVRLPLVEEGGSTGVPSSSVPQPPTASRRILVVDDNQDAADSLGTLLQQQGHKVAVAYGGEEGVAKARQWRPDLIFLDLGMPRLDGIEAAKLLRSLSGGERIALVALTGWGQEQDRQRTRDAGFNWHLVKPIDMKELNRIVSSVPEPA